MTIVTAEEDKCKCSNKKHNLIVRFPDLSLQLLQVIIKNKPALEITKYFADLDPEGVNVTFTPNGYTFKNIMFKPELTEEQIDLTPVSIDLASSPGFSVLEISSFDIFYDENGRKKKLLPWVTQIIVKVIKQIFTLAVKKELLDRPSDGGVITKSLIAILGKSLSKIVDEITHIIGISYPMRGTTGLVKSYSNVTMGVSFRADTNSPQSCNYPDTCPPGYTCVNGTCVKT
jgi:hypothetical protein